MIRDELRPEDPRFDTREALEQWAKAEAAAVANQPALYQLKPLARIRRVTLAHAHLLDSCAQCGARPIRDTLDGEPLCQTCCDKWARGEGAQIDGEANGIR